MLLKTVGQQKMERAFRKHGREPEGHYHVQIAPLPFPHPSSHITMFINQAEYEQSPQLTEEDLKLEQQVFAKCVRSYLDYGPRNLAHNAKRRSDFANVPEQQKRHLPDLLKKINDVDLLIQRNAKFLRLIAEEHAQALPMVKVRKTIRSRQTRLNESCWRSEPNLISRVPPRW